QRPLCPARTQGSRLARRLRQTASPHQKMSDIKDDTQDPNQPDQASGHSTEDDWAAAMAEQQSAHDQPTQASGLGSEDDWAAALAEQTASTQTPAAQSAATQVFQPLANQAAE